MSSDPAQIANSEASMRKPSSRLVSIPLFTASIENLTPSGALALIWLRMASARGIRLAERNDLVHQADAISLLSIDDFAGQNDLQRPAFADQTRKTLRSAVAGHDPNLTSGCPNLADSEAIRIVHAIASSHPPPRAKPLTAAITGLPRFSIKLGYSLRMPRTALPPAAAVSLDISAISAPAANALSPAAGQNHAADARESSRASSKAVFQLGKLAWLSALRTFGRLSVTYAIGPFFSYRMFSSCKADAVEPITLLLLQ